MTLKRNYGNNRPLIDQGCIMNDLNELQYIGKLKQKCGAAIKF